jgi:hypothetical protein
MSNPLNVKYYTHFLLREPMQTGMSEFRGVVELDRAVSRGDSTQAAAVLAKNFECESKHIKILLWARLH